ncbi:MAG: dTDP-glucose 4,6-dehydratase [Clostridia bacterium]|nr:dTDP-glucose 4,6-dehydratase [Clostridia bacterium]
MKNILVTGGAGFIGSNFVLYMLEKYDYKIVNLDALTYAGNLENLKTAEGNPKHVFVHGDICDTDLVEGLMQKYDFDYIVNFAAESHVDRSIENPDIFVRTNINGTLSLLNAAKNVWKVDAGKSEGRKFLQVSTDEVYGSLGESGYFTETTPLDAHSPYSASKAGADMLVKAYFDTYGMPVNITRCSNNYGPYQFPEKLIPLLINNSLKKKSLPVYGDGLNIRDWLFVKDHCRAIDMVLHEGRLGEVYNIGGHNERTNIQIVKTVIGYLHDHVDRSITEGLITYVGDRKGHDRRYGIDPEKIRNELGWQPEVLFEEGIVKTIQWYLDNREWMEHVTSGEYENYYNKMYDNAG